MNDMIDLPPGSPARIDDARLEAPEMPEGRPTPGHVPISALLDERDKRQAERARADGLETQIAAMLAQAQPAQPLEPHEAVKQALYAQNLRSSRRFAEREYGKDQIASVHDWAARQCDQDPAFNEQMRGAEDPYEAACQAFNREQVLATVKPGDLAAFNAWREAQASQGAQVQAPAKAPPRTLANAPGNGGAGRSPIGPGQAFAAVIRR